VIAAFERFAEAYPCAATLLIGTYDTELAAERVVGLASKLRSRGIRVKGARLDSGDLATLAKDVRRSWTRAARSALRQPQPRVGCLIHVKTAPVGRRNLKS